MSRYLYSQNFGQTPMPGQTPVGMPSGGSIEIPPELTIKDAALPSAPSGTGLSQTIIIIAVLGTIVGVLFMFFNLFKD